MHNTFAVGCHGDSEMSEGHFVLYSSSQNTTTEAFILTETLAFLTFFHFFFDPQQLSSHL